MRIIGKIFTGVVATAAMSIAVMGLKAQDDKKTKKAQEINLIGEPERCIEPRNISASQVLDSETIEFRMFGGKFYRSNLGRVCPGLSRGDPIKYQLRGTRLCAVDTFTILDVTAGRIDQRATCGFGPFQEIEKIKAKKNG